jgi:succinyl-CoA:acetate CoA-transferase
MKERVRSEVLRKKIMSAEKASRFIQDGMTVGTSGFTPAGYPKAVPLALAKRAKEGERLKINLITGARKKISLSNKR